jgi:hypothetical protein
VQNEETATILRFVVMFASDDGLAVLVAASNATDCASAMFLNRVDRSGQDRPRGAPQASLHTGTGTFVDLCGVDLCGSVASPHRC